MFGWRRRRTADTTTLRLERELTQRTRDLIDVEQQLEQATEARQADQQAIAIQTARGDDWRDQFEAMRKRVVGWRVWAQFTFFGGGVPSGTDDELQRRVSEQREDGDGPS